MFKVNNRNTRTRSEICSKLTIKIPERRHWRRSGIFIINFEHVLHLFLVFLLLILSRQLPAGSTATQTVTFSKLVRETIGLSHLFPVFQLLTLSNW